MGKNLTSSGPKSVKNSSVTKEIKLSLFTAAVSATLRMVVPVLGLFLIGLTIDFLLLQEAFYAIIGAAVGLLIAAFLIYLQIRKLKAKGQDSLVDDHDGVVRPKATKHPKEKR
jgi:uncharacterized membrane protein